MTRHHSLLVGLLLVSAMSAISLPVLCDPPAKTILPPASILPPPAQKTSLVKDFGRLPLSFERNQGQTDTRVRFLAHSGDSTLFLTPTEAVFAMPAQPRRQAKNVLSGHKKPSQPAQIPQTALRMQMVGADPKATVLQQQPLEGRINYFVGKDPSKWHAGVPTFGRVGFHGVYPGVDVVYYGNQRRLEYDFVVAPHADPQQIKLRFAGARAMRIDSAGDLIVRVQGQELRWQKPRVYQQGVTGKRAVAAHYRLKRLPNGQESVGFVLGRYDAARSLIIDPILTYSTFLGGSDDDGAYGIALDNSGNTYLAGYASSPDFPTTQGAFQTQRLAPNAFVAKLNAAGTNLVYSTYLGGSNAFGDFGLGIAIDNGGNAYVTGYTYSADFPTTTGAFQRVKNGTSNNGFVTKLNATGSSLVYSTYLGGSGNINHPDSIAIDSNGNAYVTGFTTSTDFPVTPGVFQSILHSQNTPPDQGVSTNAFVTKLNSTGTALAYSTFLGGSASDRATGIAIDSSGDTYVTGWASSSDFPTTSGAFQTVMHKGAVNAFVTKIDPTAATLIYSTYLGGSTTEIAQGIALDGAGSAYITGSAYSLDFPTTPGAYQRVKNGGTGTSNAFVTKFNPNGTALAYSTYLGGSNLDTGNGIAIDNSGNVYVTGYTRSIDFPSTSGAFQHGKNAGSYSSAFVARLNSTGALLRYATYLGGSGANGDNGNGIASDNNGNAYVAGLTSSTDFPATLGVFQPTNHATTGYNNAFITKLSTLTVFPDFNNDGKTDLLLQNPSTGAIASWYMNGSTQVGTAPFSLTPPVEYALVGVGDFSGTGSTTLVLQSSITNQIAFWYTSGANNATIPGGNFVNTTPPAGWKVVGVGDFNDDGKSDLVLQNQTTNQVAIWFMNGYLYQGGVLMPYTPPTEWSVVGTGDFNADGFTDIAFQNQTTGQIALWYMNGPTYAGGTTLTTIPAAGWKIVGVGDYNGDGSADLLFQNQTSNQAAVWYLKNGAYAGGATLSLTPPPGWKIVGPR